MSDHGLYDSTSCCLSHMAKSTEGDFRPFTDPRPLNRFSSNLKYITTSRIRPRVQNFRGLRQRGWSGQITVWLMRYTLSWRLADLNVLAHIFMLIIY